MTNQALALINDAFEAPNIKSLISKFSSGRFDKDMKWSAEKQFATAIIGDNRKLQECSPQSIQGAMLDVAYTGLSLSPTLAHAYLIPYGNTCKFRPGYRGLLHMAYKAGTIKSVQVNLVYEGDQEFKVWTDEHGRHIRHVENARGKRGDITHAYCIAHLTAGGPPLIEVMSRAQLNAVRAAAERKSGGGAVWRSWPEEMMKKAVIRRASKFWPKDNGGMLEHMMQVSDTYDPVAFDDDPDTPPAEAELCINLDQQTALTDLLTDHGIAATVAPEWLRRYAQSKGYAHIEDMPARLYDDAHAALTKILDERKAATRTGTDA
jgi:phage RecT family recombinase